MKRTLFALIALAPLALVGCKKKEPEPAPVAAEPAPPPPAPVAADTSWTFGVAAYAGDRTGGAMGVVTVPFTITNDTQKGLVLTSVRLTAVDGDTKLCTSKSPVEGKAAPGMGIEAKVELTCEFDALPTAGKLPLKYFVTYQLGGEEREDKGEGTATFKR